jgi:hypothetical protein
MKPPTPPEPSVSLKNLNSRRASDVSLGVASAPLPSATTAHAAESEPYTPYVHNPKPFTYIVCAHASTSRIRNGSRVAVMPKYLSKCYNLNTIGAQSMADALTSLGGT